MTENLAKRLLLSNLILVVGLVANVVLTPKIMFG